MSILGPMVAGRDDHMRPVVGYARNRVYNAIRDALAGFGHSAGDGIALATPSAHATRAQAR